MRVILACLALLAALPARAQEFRCPEGITVRLSDGRTLVQRGADPADPLLCRREATRDGETRQEALYLNALPQPEGVPETTRAERRAAIASLLPLRAGATASYRLGERTVTFTVRDITPRRLPAGEFTLVSLLEETSMPAGKIVALHGLDAATGAYLHFFGEFQMGGMFTRAIPAEAVAVSPAAGR